MIYYQRVEWIHEYDDHPSVTISEVRDSWEVRKVDKFLDGRVQYADEHGGTGDSEVGEKELPSLAEIAEDPQFIVSVMSKDEFEREWSEAIRAPLKYEKYREWGLPIAEQFSLGGGPDPDSTACSESR